MRVLLALEAGAGPMSLSQIAARSEMQPSKVHRYLVSLGRARLGFPGAHVGPVRPWSGAAAPWH